MDTTELLAVSADTAAPADDGIDAAAPPKARTGTVLGLLVTAAAVLSYFIAFPLTNVLRSAELIATPASAGHDPRVRWMAVTFVSLLVGFGVVAGCFRLVSRRQMRRIDEMVETE
jgi:hypothetical protein